jgi:phage tail tape-measure protein
VQPQAAQEVAPRGKLSSSNALLVSNNITRNGTTNAFDAISGQFVGRVKDKSGKPILIDQLWGIGFGDGTGANGRSSGIMPEWDGGKVGAEKGDPNSALRLERFSEVMPNKVQ